VLYRLGLYIKQTHLVFKGLIEIRDNLTLTWCFRASYIHTYTYTATDPLSAQVTLNVEFVMQRAKLQIAIKSNQ